jgi:hypothetical protein
MSSNPTAPVIDLAALATQVTAEVDKMSKEDVIKQLTALKVRQKVTQKKQYGSESAKRSQIKQREKSKALQARAKALGVYDSVNEEAEGLAEAEFEKWQEEQTTPAEE